MGLDHSVLAIFNPSFARAAVGDATSPEPDALAGPRKCARLARKWLDKDKRSIALSECCQFEEPREIDGRFVGPDECCLDQFGAQAEAEIAYRKYLKKCFGTTADF